MLRRHQKSAPLTDDDLNKSGTPRKGSTGTIRSENAAFSQLHTHTRPPEISEPLQHVQRTSVNAIMRSKQISPPAPAGSSSATTSTSSGVSSSVQGHGHIRFPKLEEYAHFHYDVVEIPSLKVCLCDDDPCSYKHNVETTGPDGEIMYLVSVTGTAPKPWLIRRTLANFTMLDRQLHSCIFDRKFSHLVQLEATQLDNKTILEVQSILQSYLSHLSELAGGMVNCGSVLSWMEMDNRGHRLVATDDSGINTPAIAAAHVVKRYTAQAADEISLQVGDMISVIDMPMGEDTIWWRGKRGFEVGFFPSQCVEVIKDKVPSAMASRIAEPLTTVAASRKPCESVDGESLSMTSSLASSASSSLSYSSSAQSVTAATLPGAAAAVATLPRCAALFPLPLGSGGFDSSPTMMRKHGKLMSFLRTFFSHRPPRNQLKQSGIVKERVFGCDLGEHLLNSGHDVPLLLKSCTDIIETYGIVHGIYRLSGITSNIQKLRLAFDEDRVPDLKEECYLQDIHSISSLLKMYFRELPNPLLTYQLYDKFADAVRDEDNKLLKIHDVVQQLPPPHYRTTEFLMRHLAHVAAFGQETEMHSKNLAIVWAPNLLRSKELEAGGGAAALQGVGIQAVVTECLICYCDIIFSDKMPNYGSQDGLKGQKRPRPKSLAISTPTRLLSLEEARERAIGSLGTCTKFIDVGGGPKNLPSKYHTVLDVQGYKKKTSSIKEKENKPSQQGKKSPAMASRNSSNASSSSSSSGWKSIFSKPRAGSIRKARKGSGQDNVSLGPIQAKALTEEDVHNWKRNLRSAKSAESLFSMSATPSSQSSLGSRSSRSNTENGGFLTPVLDREGESLRSNRVLSHKRSLSSDASAVLHNRFMSSQDSRGFHSPMDAEEVDSGHLKQSFIRGDSTRKALHHRRVPSAPNTPNESRKGDRQRTTSGSKGDHSGGEDMDTSFDEFVYPKSESRGDVNIDAAIKSRLQQVADKNRKSNDDLATAASPMKRCAKTPPKGRKKVKGLEPKHQHGSKDNEAVQSLPQKVSPQHAEGQRGRTNMDTGGNDGEEAENRMRLIYSRFHDYAEIASDEDVLNTPSSQGTMSMSSSGCNMQDVLDQIDSRLAMNATLYSRIGPASEGNSNAISGAMSTSLQDQSLTSMRETSPSVFAKETFIGVSNFNRLPSPSPSPSHSSSKETEFPATLNSPPREVSSHSSQSRIIITDSVSQLSQGLTSEQSSYVDNVSNNISPTDGLSSQSHIYHRRADPNSNSGNGSAKFTRVVRRRAEFIPSSNASPDLDDLLDNLEVHNSQRRPLSRKGSADKRLPPFKSASVSSSPSHRPPQHHPNHPHSLHHQIRQDSFDSAKPPKSPSVDSKISSIGTRAQGQEESPQDHAGMSKCLSVPSDIARSLENVTGSQSDILSSVTISELSMSRNSFSNGIADLRPPSSRRQVDPRQRRSSSLDSLNENDRMLSRTLREINDQMEAAFKHPPSDPSHQRHRQHSPRLVSSDIDLSISSARTNPDNWSKEEKTGAIVDWSEEEPSSWNISAAVPSYEADCAVMGSPSSFHQCSDQTITPTQGSVADQFSLFMTSPRHKMSSSTDAELTTPSSASASIRQPMDVDSDLDDDSPAFITDNPQMEVCRNLTTRPGRNFPPPLHEFFPISNSPASSPSRVQNPLYDFQSSMSSVDKPSPSPPLHTDRQLDDLIVVEPPAAVVRFSRSKEKYRKSKDRNNDIVISVVRSPSDLVNFSRKETISSTSSEDFDEVASSDDDDTDTEATFSFTSKASHSHPHPVHLPDHGGADSRSGMPKRDFSLPLTCKTGLSYKGEDGINMDSGRKEPPRRNRIAQPLGSPKTATTLNSPLSVSPVVIRRHSPRAEQRSSWLDRSFSPSEPQSPMSALVSSGGSGLPNLDSDDESVFHWRNSSLFNSAGNEEEEENEERMLSLRAAGLASQRARLSRESSNSSLQSPDVSYSHIAPGSLRSPQTVQALPDVVQSTTRTERADAPPEENSRNNVPLQLALYHPDEFSMDIQAAVVSPGASILPSLPSSSSLPQVHTSNTDRVQMNRPTIRKSSTDNAISKQGEDRAASDSRTKSDRDSPHQPSGHSSYSIMPSPMFRPRTSSDSLVRMPASSDTDSYQTSTSRPSLHDQHGVNTSQARRAVRDRGLSSEDSANCQVAMEVDNLCNKLVDDLNSPCASDPPSRIVHSDESFTVSASRDIRTEQDEQGEVSMELDTTVEVKGTQPSSPLVRERRIIRSSSNDSSHNVETRLMSVQHRTDGNIEEEAVQNVLNTGREILMQPDQAHITSTESRDSNNEKLTLADSCSISASVGASNGACMRKTSFSKIPRPRSNTDTSPRSSSRLLTSPIVSTSSRNRTSESSGLSSLHPSPPGSSPSSSCSSSSSSRTSFSLSRRASEAGGLSAQMTRRSGHTRRSSDTKLSDLRSDSSPTNRTNATSSSTSSSPRCTHGARLKAANVDSKHMGAQQDSTGRSRIPLSHRVPSPQSSERERLSPNVSRPSRSNQSQGQQCKKTTSPCPKPRKLSRNSLKSDPPSDEVMEVTRSAVRKTDCAEPSRRQVAKKEADAQKQVVVVVRDLDKDGDAKLVIETLPDMKKKIQTVHAKKVPLPARQVAEGLETDLGGDAMLTRPNSSASDSQTTRSMATCASDPLNEFSESTTHHHHHHHQHNVNVKEEKENKTAPPVPVRKFGYDSLSLPRPNKNRLIQPNLTLRQDVREYYSEVIGSRSSLDDSILQLAAERQQIFIPEGEDSADGYGYSTGSLRVKRSQKLQSLVDLFEKTTESVSDSPGSSPGTRHRTYSASGGSARVEHLATCMEYESVTCEAHGDAHLTIFHQPSSPCQLRHHRTSVEARGGKDPERYPQRRNINRVDGDYDNLTSEQIKMEDTHFTKPAEQQLRSDSNKVPPEASKRSTSHQHANATPSLEATSASSSPATAPKSTRPPRYQSPKPRTFSESSASESDSMHYSDSNVTSPNLATRSASFSSSVPMAEWTYAQSDSTPPTSPKSSKNSERRGSIKELRLFFEKSNNEREPQDPAAMGPPPTTTGVLLQPRQRIRSVSPPAQMRQSRTERVNVMRLSLEIPSGSAGLPAGSHFDFKAQPVRLGPKPFYSINK